MVIGAGASRRASVQVRRTGAAGLTRGRRAPRLPPPARPPASVIPIRLHPFWPSGPEPVVHRRSRLLLVLCAFLLLVGRPGPLRAQAAADPVVARLMGLLLGPTPMLQDLQELTDRIGGRVTGSPANLRAVDWALAKFAAMGVPATKEAFRMPDLWLERSARARIEGAGIRFQPTVAAMPWSAATPAGGTRAPLLDAGTGSEADFTRLGATARGAFVLVATDELKDVDGLFKEYNEFAGVEQRAFAAGVAGLVYMGSRPRDVLHRHNVNIGLANRTPVVALGRDGARRAQRLLRTGVPLSLQLELDLEVGGPFDSYNVIGELKGREKPEEIVVIGAHLDSWDLGGGALDNGGNVALVLDLARQMQALGVRPRRTIRFALWNGEEQEMIGSWGYTKSHAAELDRHVMTNTVDIGCGRITGFFTNGRADLLAPLDRVLAPAAGLGPFTNINVPIVGTDNYDFMMLGVPNLVANQESATYGPNYHARSDEFHECDPRELRLNAAIVAAVTWGFANGDVTWGRDGAAAVEQLVKTTDLETQMRMFNVWHDWETGVRSRLK